jgi:hypothetical protein
MKNAYVAAQLLRSHLVEGSAKHWTEAEILGALIRAQDAVFKKVYLSAGDWFTKKSAALTPSASGGTAAPYQVTLPNDCMKPIKLERVDDGSPIYLDGVTVREKFLHRTTSSGLLTGPPFAFLVGNKIAFTQDSFTSQVYLWYERRPCDVHYGVSAAGGATSLTLQDDYHVSPTDDYYTGALIDAVDSSGAWRRGTILAHVATSRILTLSTGTYDADANYGIVPEFPEEGWEFWIMKALRTLTLKPGSVLTRDYHFFIRDELKSAEAALNDWISTRTKGASRVRYTGAYQHG